MKDNDPSLKVPKKGVRYKIKMVKIHKKIKLGNQNSDYLYIFVLVVPSFLLHEQIHYPIR